MKALTLVYLLAAATAASTYGTVVAAASNSVCNAGNITVGVTDLINGTNVANQCDIAGDVEGLQLKFPTSTNVRSSFKLTGKTGVYYGDIAIVQHSSYPVDITIDKAFLGSFQLNGNSLPSGSSVTFTNSVGESDFGINLMAVSTSILVSNNVFRSSDFGIDFYENDGDQVTVDVSGNAFTNSDVYIDLDNKYDATLSFKKNTLINTEFTHYTAYTSDGHAVISDNSFSGDTLYLYAQGGVFEFTKNRVNTSNVELELEDDAAVTRFDDNTVTCFGSIATGWYVELDDIDTNAIVSFSRNTFGQGCEVNNDLVVSISNGFPAGSAVNVDGNRFTIGTALVNHTFFEVDASELTASNGTATFSLSGNDFRFTNGVKPADLQNSPVVLLNADGVSSPIPYSRRMAVQSSNDLKLQMSDNVVDGKVLSTPEQLGAYFGGFTDLYNNFEGTFSSNPTQHSAAPAAASIASAAAAMAACVAFMLFA